MEPDRTSNGTPARRAPTSHPLLPTLFPRDLAMQIYAFLLPPLISPSLVRHVQIVRILQPCSASNCQSAWRAKQRIGPPLVACIVAQSLSHRAVLTVGSSLREFNRLAWNLLLDPSPISVAHGPAVVGVGVRDRSGSPRELPMLACVRAWPLC